MITDSISRPQAASAERFQRVVLPATVELIKTAIANSVVNADNASTVIENIANAVARLSSKPGAHEAEDFSFPTADLSGVPINVRQVVKDFQKSYLSGRVASGQMKPHPPVSAVQASPNFFPVSVDTPVKRQPGRPEKVKLPPVAVTPAIEVKAQAPVSTPAVKIASPVRDKVSIPIVTARAPEPVVSPVKEPSVPSLRVDMKRRATDTQPKPKIVEKRPVVPPESTRKLPKGLVSINDAIGEDYIICLDDGRKVKDLEKHLESKGMTMEGYLKKWNLSPAYPTRAPGLILSRGTVREYDIHTGEFVET